MSRGLILVAAIIGVVVLAAGWRAAADDTGAAPAREEAAAQEVRQASPEPEVRPAAETSAASDSKDPAPGGAAPENSAGATQTKRLAVDNVLQVGGFGCVSCASIIAGTLQNADGVEGMNYEVETDTYVVTVNEDFRINEVARQLRSISKDYNRQIGLPDRPDWVLKEV